MWKKWRPHLAGINRIIQTISKHYQMANVSDSAAVLAYYTLLSLFPALLVLASLLPFFHIETSTVMDGIAPFLPDNIYDILAPIIHSFLNNRNGSVLSIGVIVAIWSSSRAVAAFQRTVNGAYGVVRKQNAIVSRIMAFFWMVALIAFLFLMMLFFSVGQVILERLTPLLQLPTQLLTYVNAAKWPVTFIMTFLLLMILFYFVPSVKLKLRYVWPGALTATLGWLLLSQAFSWYLKFFVHNIDSYKTIGTFIVLMFWLDFTALILMFGAVLNAAIQDLIEGTIEEQAVFTYILRNRLKRNSKGQG